MLKEFGLLPQVPKSLTRVLPSGEHLYASICPPRDNLASSLKDEVFHVPTTKALTVLVSNLCHDFRSNPLAIGRENNGVPHNRFTIAVSEVYAFAGPGQPDHVRCSPVAVSQSVRLANALTRRDQESPVRAQCDWRSELQIQRGSWLEEQVIARAIACLDAPIEASRHAGPRSFTVRHFSR